MKGSPILSTITAALIMAGAYLWLDLSLQSKGNKINQSSQGQNNQNLLEPKEIDSEESIHSYIEAHFSSPPRKFILSDAASGKIIANVSDLTDNEWSGQIHLLKAASVDLAVQAIWENEENRQHFIQLVLSPDQMQDTEVTLRSTGKIDTTASFKLSQ